MGFLDDLEYYALAYNNVTGQIVGELPFIDAPCPPFLQQVNQKGSWSLQIPIGKQGGLNKEDIYDLTDSGRFGVAICYGNRTAADYIAQAGPIWQRNLVSENPPVWQISGEGFAGLLAATINAKSTWTGNSLAASALGDMTIVSSMQGTCVKLLNNALLRNSLPLVVPAEIAGTISNSYFVYDLVSVWQRLQELSQQDGGPDMFFKPVFADDSHIQFLAQIGNPTIQQPGSPIFFDYPGSIVSCLPTSDGVNVATDTYEKGGGTQATTSFAKASNYAAMAAIGYPRLETVNSDHSDITDVPTLQRHATADEAINALPVETWNVRVRMDAPDQPFGTYDCGYYATYDFDGHCAVRDGAYNVRIIGIQQGPNFGEVVHILHILSPFPNA